MTLTIKEKLMTTTCNTKTGRLTHYTKDGVLTLCNYEVAKREPTHKLREAPFCRRCEKAEEKLDG